MKKTVGKNGEVIILCKCEGRMLSVKKILTNEIIGYKCVKCRNVEMLT
jgi:predicted SprT family Zn-dependent metalloprotease